MKSDRFRLGVGAVIWRADGLVLALERSDVPGAWQFVQGGVKRGEDLRDALFREVREETGLEPSDVAAIHEVPVLLGYELPASARRKKTRGQVHQWFFLEFRSTDATIRLDAGGEFTRFRWAPIAEVIEGVVTFRLPVYRELGRWAAELLPALIIKT